MLISQIALLLVLVYQLILTDTWNKYFQYNVSAVCLKKIQQTRAWNYITVMQVNPSTGKAALC